MRDEVRQLLDELEPVPQDQGLGLVAVKPKRPDLAQRSKIWDLAIKLGRELGSSIDVAPATTALPRARRPRKVDFG